MIHRALKMLRVYHNLKQKDLAPDLGISSSYLCELESGNKTVTYEMLENYARKFKIPVSTIAFFAEASDTPKKKMSYKIPDKALHFLEWMHTITSHECSK